MNSERLKIYNKNVINVKQQINLLVKDILAGKKDIQEMSDFVILFNQVQSLQAKYNALYENINNEQARETLFKFVEPEYQLLRELSGILRILNKYNEKNLLLNVEDVKKEWQDVKVILQANLLRQNLDRVSTSFFGYSKKVEMDRYVNEFFAYVDDYKDFDPDFILAMQDYQKETEKVYSVGAFEELNEQNEAIESSANEAKQRIRFPDYALKEDLKNASAAISETIKNKTLETIHAYDSICERIDIEEETQEEEDEFASLKEKNKDVRLDWAFYDGLSLVGQKEYLRLLLSNIEHAKGKKRVVRFAGRKVRIPKIYYARYLKYRAMLATVKKDICISQDRLDKELREQEKELELISSSVEKETEKKCLLSDLQKNIDTETVSKIYDEELEKNRISVLQKETEVALRKADISPEMERKFVSDYCKWLEAKYVMRNLEKQAVKQMHEGLVSTVTSVTGKSTCIPSSEEKVYDVSKNNYGIAENNLVAFSDNTSLSPIYTREDSKKCEKVLDKIFEKFVFLKEQNVVDVPAIKEEINSLFDARKRLLRDKLFSNHAMTIAWFQMIGESYENSKMYADVLISMEENENVNAFTDQEKLSFFMKLQSKIKEILHSVDDTVLDGEWWVIEEQSSKVKEVLASLPSSFHKVVSKIKGIRKAKNKKKIPLQVKVASIAAALGTGVFILSSFVSEDLNNVNAKIEYTQDVKETDASLDKAIEDEENIYNVTNLFHEKKTDDNDLRLGPDLKVELAKNTNEVSPNLVNATEYFGISSSNGAEASSTMVKNVVEEKVEKEEGEVSLVVQEESEIEDSTLNTEQASESLHLRWGDVVHNLPGTPVYTSFDRASMEKEPLKAYCAPESAKEITGIIYFYNGTVIFMGKDNPLYTEDDLIAIENMGAVQIGYRAFNEDTGMKEGYFNMSGLDRTKLEERSLGR